MPWESIHRFDQLMTLEVNSWSSPVTDQVWKVFSSVPVWIPMYILIAALLIWKLGWKKGLVSLVAVGLTFAFCDQFSNLIKAAVGRIRPLNDAFMLEGGLNILEKGSKSFGFFSAHAANAFGLATCTYLSMKNILLHSSRRMPSWFKTYTVWMFLWASLVALSRVFVGKHYLGDIIVGAAVGAIAGYAFSSLFNYILKRTKL